MNRLTLCLTGIIIFSARLTGQSSSQFPAEKLDSFVTRAMNDWHLMGLAISIVKKDSVIFAKGWGYRDFENKLPVTENTAFPIASCSKTFTTALLGIAERDGKIQLNKPVCNYFPELQFYNDSLTNQVTAEDMLSHRTGSAGHDWAWTFNTNFTEDVYLKRIKYHEPVASLRTEFQYSNFMFFALSVLTGKLYNTTWSDVISKKLFEPLEMINTYSNYASRQNKYANAALKYEFQDGFNLRPSKQMDDLLGAGSVNSTAADLGRYLQMWINGGSYKNIQVLPRAFVRRSVESHFMVHNGLNNEYPDEHFNNIGLSWFLSSYRGHYKAHHNGNIDGFSSSISFFPFDSLGIIVLTNQNNSPLIRLIPDFVADVVFNLTVRDKNSPFVARRKKRQADIGHPRLINADSINTQPLFSINKYTGRFENPGYGEVKIETYKKALVLTYYDLKLLLIPKEAHRFSSHYWWEEGIFPDGVGDVIFHFKNGVLESFQIPFEPVVKDIVFRKK